MRSFDADVCLLMGSGPNDLCRRCRSAAQVAVQLPWPGEKATEILMCKSCISDIIEEHFNNYE